MSKCGVEGASATGLTSNPPPLPPKGTIENHEARIWFSRDVVERLIQGAQGFRSGDVGIWGVGKVEGSGFRV